MNRLGWHPGRIVLLANHVRTMAGCSGMSERQQYWVAVGWARHYRLLMCRTGKELVTGLSARRLVDTQAIRSRGCSTPGMTEKIKQVQRA